MSSSTAATQMAYLEDYLDTIEALPLELSRNLTLMRELAGLADDVENSIKTETKGFVETLRALPTPEARTAKIANLTAVFKEYLKHGEDKVALAVQTYDLVDRHIRRLDDDLAKYEDEQMTGPRTHGNYYTGEIIRDTYETGRYAERKSNNQIGDTPNKQGTKRKQISRGDKPSTPQPETAPTGGNVAGAGGARKDKNSRAPGGGGGTGTTTTGSGVAAGKTGRSARSGATGSSSGNGNGGMADLAAIPFKSSPDDLPIDPNEPRYCVCNGVSYGEMIGCDNADCEIEWFHYGCVGLSEKVEGTWFCPQCRDRRDKKAKRRV